MTLRQSAAERLKDVVGRERLSRTVDKWFAAESHPLRRSLVMAMLGLGRPYFLDYEVEEIPRWGHGRPPHPRLYDLVDARRDAYRELLQAAAGHVDDFLKIPNGAEQAGPEDPTWVNDWFGGLDGVALYTLLAQNRTARYVEIGSGMSTKWARRAARDRGLATHITSIDPVPRSEIDAVADRVIPFRLEESDLAVFDDLGAGDIAFLDGSHRAIMNSDVTVFLLEVLPRLKPGVLVQIHDILIPYDYPADWAGRHYSEQYALAAYLLGGAGHAEIVFPSAFVDADPELRGVLAPLWDHPYMTWATRHGSSFWLRATG